MDDTLRIIASRTLREDGVWINADELLAWSIGRGETVVGFIDRIGGEIAKAYQAGELTYAICDGIVNDLWGLLLEETVDGSAGSWPEIFYRVYDAFDAGEDHRRADGSDDPVAEFTDPAISEIVVALERQRLVNDSSIANDR